MIDLTTKYGKLNLSNPFIVSSSSLTNSVEKIRRCEEAGAGAVVMKSLFEEQIYEEKIRTADPSLQFSYHAEAAEYIHQMSMSFGPEEYLNILKGAKKTVKIPVIASLNCISREWWLDYAKRIEKAGADALELNLSFITHDSAATGQEIEKRLLTIVEEVTGALSIPVYIKIGANFSSLAHLVKEIERRKAAGMVMFNRFYQIDIDPDTLELKPGYILTPHEEVTKGLRWVALLSKGTKMSLAGAGGIYTGEDVAKYLLAGADAVQLCSVLFKNKVDHLRKIDAELRGWMEHHGFTKISDFAGRLARAEGNAEAWERQQYIKALVGLE